MTRKPAPKTSGCKSHPPTRPALYHTRAPPPRPQQSQSLASKSGGFGTTLHVTPHTGAFFVLGLFVSTCDHIWVLSMINGPAPHPHNQPPTPTPSSSNQQQQQPTIAREHSSCFVSAASLPSSKTTRATAPSHSPPSSSSRAHGGSSAGTHATQQHRQPSSSDWASSASGRYIRVHTGPPFTQTRSSKVSHGFILRHFRMKLSRKMFLSDFCFWHHSHTGIEVKYRVYFKVSCYHSSV